MRKTRGAAGGAPEDLGFGTRVRTGRGERLLERDGTFTVRRSGLPLRAVISLSHTLMTMRWPRFLGLLVAGYLAANGLFALGYVALGEEALAGPGNGFSRAFFFSVQTASTIGYGHVLPATRAADVLVTCEALVALIGFALVSGLVFARFTRPIADIVFSDHAIVAPYRGITGLEFRVANRRRTQIIEVQARVFLSIVESRDGRTTRSFEELALERNHLSFFPLSWTVVHPIDESSPLHQRTAEDLIGCDAEVLILLNGIDETFSHTVHARSSYKADEIVWGKRFANIYERTASGNPTAIDVSRIDQLEAV